MSHAQYVPRKKNKYNCTDVRYSEVQVNWISAHFTILFEKCYTQYFRIYAFFHWDSDVHLNFWI